MTRRGAAWRGTGSRLWLRWAAAAEDALRGAKARQVAAHEAYQAKLPGAGARKMAAKARAAAQKAKERRAGGAEPATRTPTPRTPEQVAAAEQKFNAQDILYASFQCSLSELDGGSCGR